MAEEVTKLSLAVDSTQVTRAHGELDKFAASGKTAETAATGFERASKGVGSAMAGIASGAAQAGSAQQGLASGAERATASLEAQAVASRRVQTAQASLALAQARVATAQEAFNRALEAGPARQNDIAAATARIQAAQAQQANAAARLAVAQAAASTSTKTLGAASALTAQQAQQLSFQLNDLFVQIAAGQNPITALVQQGSQLNGTFGGIGGTLRALGSVFTATRVVFGGLAAAAVGLAVAFHQGAEESLAFQRAIILTGNAAGITEGQFNEMARSIAQSTNTTIGGARETLQALVASGRFSGEALAQAARGVQLLSKATGQSSDEIVKDFVKAADGPTRFAEQTNRSLNFLTAKQLDYIRTLEDQGRSQEALAETFRLLNDRTDQAAQKVGTLERAWQGLKNQISGVKDALLSIGRDTTAEDRIAEISRALDRAANNPNLSFADRQAGGIMPALSAEQRAALEAERQALRAVVETDREAARAAGQVAQTNQARIAFDKLREQSLTRQARLAKELADANALADRAGLAKDAKERLEVLAGIREKFASLDADANKHAKAALAADLAEIQQTLKDRNEAVRNAQTVFAALQQAGQLDEETAFDNTRLRLHRQAEAEEQALQQEIAARSKRKFVGKEAADLELQNATRIGEATREIERIRNGAAAADEALTIQQIANSRRRVAAQQQEQIAVAQAFEAVKRAHDLELALFGAGDLERSRAQARAQIEEKFRADIERATNEIQSKRTAGTATSDDEREFEARQSLLREFLQRSLEEWDAYYARRRSMEQDVNLGAAEAFRNYRDEASNTARIAEGFFSRSLQGIEDALVQFVQTGKLNWKSLADSIIADITRIIIKQQIANALGSEGGGSTAASLASAFAGFFGGGRATGGDVKAGRIYEINEREGPGEILSVAGRQYLLAAENGRVEPQRQSSQSNTTNNTNIRVSVEGQVDRRTRYQLANEISREQRMASRLA